jgi:hypothetical protein
MNNGRLSWEIKTLADPYSKEKASTKYQGLPVKQIFNSLGDTFHQAINFYY